MLIRILAAALLSSRVEGLASIRQPFIITITLWPQSLIAVRAIREETEPEETELGRDLGLISFHHLSLAPDHPAAKSQEAQAQAQVGFGLSLSLFATIAWDMFLLWMLLNPDPQVKSYSIKTLSTCMVIFMALAIEHALSGHAVRGINFPAMTPVFLCLSWLSVCGVALKLRHSAKDFAAAVSLTAHITAFLGISTFGKAFEKLRKGMTTHGAWTCIGVQTLVLLLLAVLSAVLVHATMLAVQKMLPSDETGDRVHEGETTDPSRDSAVVQEDTAHGTASSHGPGHRTHEFLEELHHHLTEAVCILLSYLAKKRIVSALFVICGMPDYALFAGDIDTPTPTPTDNFKYFLFALGLCTVSMYLLLPCVTRYAPGNSTLLLFLSFLTAWTSCGLVKWTTYMFLADTTCIRIATAILCSFLSCTGLVVIEKLADLQMLEEKRADDLVPIFGLIIGVSWEKAYDASLHTTIDHLQLANVEAFGELETFVMSAILVVVMLPGWRILVLPLAMEPTPPRFAKHRGAQAGGLNQSQFEAAPRLSTTDTQEM